MGGESWRAYYSGTPAEHPLNAVTSAMLGVPDEAQPTTQLVAEYYKVSPLSQDQQLALHKEVKLDAWA